MNVWGRGSTRHLTSTSEVLKDIAEVVLQLRDHSVICGHRPEATQNEYFANGTSKVRWPDSKHNNYPSHAVDVQPAPYNEATLREDLTLIAGMYIGVGKMMGWDIRWGGDWNQNGQTADNNFDDLFHLELHGRCNAPD